MPRYFFDLHDGQWSRDDEGIECEDLQGACREARRTLPAMALDRVLRNGDHHTIMVLVADESRQPVYTAALTFAGLLMKG